MSAALAWLFSGSRGEKSGQDSSTAERPAASLSAWHYGREHHMDIYEPMPLEVKKAAVRDLFEQVCHDRVEQAAAGKGAFTAAEVAARNARQAKVMEQHFNKVEIVHKMLRRAASREDEALYRPKDCIPEREMTFEEWKHRELMGVVKRREKAIEVDAGRPDINRRSTSNSFFSVLDSLSPVEYLTTAPQEPGQWPKRRFYYPATDFSQLSSPTDKPAEELMLEQRLREDRKTTGHSCTLTLGGTSTLIALWSGKYRAPVLIGTSLAVGFAMDRLIATYLTSSEAQRDLDDFIVAKHCWFVKNRPDVYSLVETGVSRSNKTAVFDRTNIEGGVHAPSSDRDAKAGLIGSGPIYASSTPPSSSAA